MIEPHLPPPRFKERIAPYQNCKSWSVGSQRTQEIARVRFWHICADSQRRKSLAALKGNRTFGGNSALEIAVCELMLHGCEQIFCSTNSAILISPRT
jgi:hypothetical protein